MKRAACRGRRSRRGRRPPVREQLPGGTERIVGPEAAMTRPRSTPGDAEGVEAAQVARRLLALGVAPAQGPGRRMAADGSTTPGRILPARSSGLAVVCRAG